MDSELDEAACVDEQLDPLARGELAGLVLARNPLLAAAELRPLAAGVQILGQRPETRLVAHLPFHCGSRFSKNAVTPSIASSVESSIVSCERR